MPCTRAQLRVEAAATVAALPDELLLRVLERVMLDDGLKEWRGAVRGVSRRRRAISTTVRAPGCACVTVV